MSQPQTTSPADELRAAAALIRARVQWATPGPWCAYTDEVCTDWHSDSADYKAVGSDIQVAAGTSGTSDHIALWHPGVTLAVAAWLEAEADALDRVLMYAEVQGSVVRAALTVARLVLGTAS